MKRQWFVGFCLLFGLTLPLPAVGEEPSAAQQDAESAATSPELVEFVKKWVAAAPQGEIVEVTYDVYIYDDIFYTETRGVGRYVLQGPDQGLFELKPIPLDAAVKSKRITPDGEPYLLGALSPELWYWDGEYLNLIDAEEKTYTRSPVSQTASLVSDDDRSTDTDANTPLAWDVFFGKRQLACPMVVRMDAAQLLKDYRWSQGPEHRAKPLLVAKPKAPPLRREVQRVEVLVDQETLQAKAVGLTDPTGNTRRLNVIKSVKTDAGQIGQWRPDLSQYKLMKAFEP